MRIFCAVRHSNDSAHFYGGLWSGNFYPALRELGHEIIESQVDLLPTSRFMGVADGFTQAELEVRARTTEEILTEVRIAHKQVPVDLFLSYFYNAHFDPRGFEGLRRLGIPSVNYYCNSIHQFKLVAAIATHADFAWHTEREARSLYHDAGANPVWVQMGADPTVYYPIEGVSRESKACFVGQRYADRDRLAAALVRAGVPLSIYGPGWKEDSTAAETSLRRTVSYLDRTQPRAGTAGSYAAAARDTVVRLGFVRGISRLRQQIRYRRESARLSPVFRAHARGAIPFEEIAGVFSSHEVCLNFSNVWADGRPGSDLIPHVRLRDFEGPMCRTCYLTGDTEEIREFYKVGSEIDTYSSREELIAKTRFYLAHPEAAEILRSAGYARAKRDHTWQKRFQELFDKIGLSS